MQNAINVMQSTDMTAHPKGQFKNYLELMLMPLLPSGNFTGRFCDEWSQINNYVHPSAICSDYCIKITVVGFIPKCTTILKLCYRIIVKCFEKSILYCIYLIKNTIKSGIL